MGRIVIQEHRPLRGVVMAVLVAGLAVASSSWYFLQGRADQQATLSSLRDRVGGLETLIARQQAELNRARRLIANHAKAREVEAKAYAGVEQHLSQVQTNILALEEEVAFYRSLVSTSARSGLRVQRLFLFPGQDALNYRFQVVLTRYTRDDKVSSGSISLSVAGDSDGQVLDIPADALFGDGKLNFSFKYFHRVEGQFDLPPEFIPRRVHLRVNAPGEVPAVTEKSFDWVVTTG